MPNENGHNARAYTFTDRYGREWDVTLTLGSAKRVDASDFSELWDKTVSFIAPSKELFQELMTNKPLAMGIVWAIIKPQADELEPPLSAEAFLDSLDGDALSEAINSLWETLASFFPQAKTVILNLRDLQTRAEKRAQAGLANLTEKAGAEIDRLVDAEIAKIDEELGTLGGKFSQASPG